MCIRDRGVEDEALAVEDFFVLAQNDAGAAGIVVLYDGGDGDAPLFGLGQQGLSLIHILANASS